MLSRMANVLDIKFDIQQRDKPGACAHGLAGRYLLPVKRAERRPASEMTKGEKLAILNKYEGSWPKWTPDVDLEDEYYKQ